MVDLKQLENANDEELYDLAINEIKSGSYSEALWSKALAKSDFDNSKAKGMYVELRVEQLKAQQQFDLEVEEETERLSQELEESKIEIAATEKENAELMKQEKKLEQAVNEKKFELKFQNVLMNPLFMIQAILLATYAGVMQKSWWYFGGTFVALIILMLIPKIGHLVGFTLACLFGGIGYFLGTEWWGENPGYISGGVAFIIVFGSNFELMEKNKEVDEISLLSR